MDYPDFAPAELDDSAIAALKSFETELSSKAHQDIVLIAYTANESAQNNQVTSDIS
ncbi:hypothetical protein D3C75_488370 [compost metagenome]